MRDASDGSALLEHLAFLARAGSGKGGRTSLAAFLVLRLVDAVGEQRRRPNELKIQCKGAREYLGGIAVHGVEYNHLVSLVRVSEAATDRWDPRVLVPALLAYGGWLEQELRLDEALDVLDTAHRIAHQYGGEDETLVLLQRGRALRLASRYDESLAAYAAGLESARAAGDRSLEFRARIGTGVVMYKTGRLKDAEGILLAVAEEAQKVGDRTAESWAAQDLSSVYWLMKRPVDVVQYSFRSLELAATGQTRLGSLLNLGVGLKELGRYDSAADAFRIVLREESAVTEEALERRGNTLNELLDVASLTGNRIEFARRKREVERLEDRLVPDTRVDFHLKLGIGYGRFGDHGAAIEHLRQAIALAEEHRLNKYLFDAEKCLHDLESGALPASAAPPSKPESSDPETDRVCAELREMVSA